MPTHDIPDDWKRSFLERNPGDEHRLSSAYESDRPKPSSGGGGSSGQSSGGGGGGGGYNEQSNPWMERQTKLLDEMWGAQKARDEQQRQAEAERKQRGDELYGTWLGRSQQGLQLNADDPTIKGQVDVYRAEQDRALRNALSDSAEAGGLGDTRKRMASERTSQNVASFQAELMARELGTRRAEVADALQSMGGLLSGDQQAGLQRELASLDNAVRQFQAGVSARDTDLRGQLGFGDLNLRGQLGNRGLDNDLMRILMQNEQFYGDLGLRNRTQDDQYNLYSSGRLGNPI